MPDRIHDDEIDTSEPVVRALLAAQIPPWAELDLVPLGGTGTSNALWRVAEDGRPAGVVRLPRTTRSERSIRTEIDLLPVLAERDLPFEIPTLLHAGTATDVYPLWWAATDWLTGTDAWINRDHVAEAGVAMAADLAAVVRTISGLVDLPVPARGHGSRGGPLDALLSVLDYWLTDARWQAADRLPVHSIRRLADEARELVDEWVDPTFLHGDLIPGNLLVAHQRITAVLDWGGAGYGDPADDLVPAWAILDEPARSAFRAELGVDDATWIRARTFALEQAVGGALYYVPKGHPLGDVMTRTLARILEEG